MYYLSILDVLGEETLVEVVDSLAMPSSIPSTNYALGINGSLITIFLILMINIGIIVFQFILNGKLNRKEALNHKIKLINENTISCEAHIYSELLNLSNFDSKGDMHQMLDAIVAVDDYITKNKLFISKDFYSYTVDFLDYFKGINFNLKKKNIKTENKYFELLCNCFHGE